MTKTEALDTVDHCLQLLGEINTGDEFQREWAVNTISEKLWEVRERLEAETEFTENKPNN